MADTHVISALKAKRAEIAGHIEHLNKDLDQARSDIMQIEGALRVFGYDQPVSDIRPKKFRTANLFKRNEIARFIFDHLRSEPDGLLTNEIADRLMIHKGWDMRDTALHNKIKHRVGNALYKLGKQGVVAPGEMHGPARMWRMPGPSSPSTGAKLDEPSPE